jgi:tetratricopeptide (TPR) repeat protein
MTSRLLANIETEIASAKSEVAADCSRAKRVCFLVRVGRTEEANTELTILRERYRHTPVAEVAARLNLAEGLLNFFSGSTTSALDKVRRAHAISKAASMPRELALSAAWLAHLEFSLLQVDAMVTHLREAFVHAERDDYEALSRASLVAAVAAHSSDRYDLAKPWYTNARVHAVAEGDDATLSALLHNMTSMGVMNLRQAVLTGNGESKLALDALMGANSTSSYDALKGMLGLVTWIPLLRAYVASLVGDPTRAIELYEAHIEQARAEGQLRMLSYIYADLAWCHMQVGEVGLASGEVSTALQSLASETQIDDRAATHSRLGDIFTAMGSASANEHYQSAKELWRDYASLQVRTLGLLEDLSRYATPAAFSPR